MDKIPVHLRPQLVTVGEWEELNKKVDRSSDSIFGYWDEEEHARVPGFHERLKRIDWMQKGLMGIGVVLLLNALGVPTQELGPVVQKLMHLL